MVSCLFWVGMFLFESSVYAEVAAEIEIAAPLQSVWTYVQEDVNASHWSIFFSSIEMAPIDEYPQNRNLQASDLGYVRRCYRNSNKMGLRWDEENIRIERGDERITKEIRSFNFIGYGSWYNVLSFRVLQEYVRIDESTTLLRFFTEPYSQKELTATGVEIGFLKYQLLMFLHRLTSQSRTLEIFQKNLENIKYGIENGHLSAEEKKWPHRFEKFCNLERDIWCRGPLVDF